MQSLVQTDKDIVEIEEVLRKAILEKLNEMVVSEAEKYLEETKDIKGQRIAGYRTKDIWTVYGKMRILYPKFYKAAKGFGLSFVDKYSRHLKNDLKKMQALLLNTNITYKDIKVTTSFAPPLRLRKKRDEVIREQISLMKDKCYSYKFYKLDSTALGSLGGKKSMYILWGSDGEKPFKPVYHFSNFGNENGEGWHNMVDWMKNHLDLQKVELFITDLFGSLKTALSSLGVPLQNCLWHRLDSLFSRVQWTTEDKKENTGKYYDRLFKANNKQEAEEILKEFLEFPLKIRKEKGKVSLRRHERMLDKYWEDNFRYFDFPVTIRKKVMQVMDIESKHSLFKEFLRKRKMGISEERLDILFQKFKISYNMV